MDDLKRRAFAAWFRSGSNIQPGDGVSGVEEHGGKEYVVLRNGVDNVLAVYRVRNNGVLKGLKRWPKSIEAA